ncbi:N66 matrix protein-like [Helianthus annuus]|uniref:N66 matrix protein-like n=1 Tax=Helianthus annuus TaxID=4232 RepID=UPI000B8F309B|nr:N66 matrix protein-like [Helianthus annuus]
MVDPEFKCIERFIWGLAPQIMSMMTTSKPATITEAIDLSVALTEEAIRLNKFSISDGKKKETHIDSSGENKRKFSNFKKGTSSANKKKEANPPAEVKTSGAISSVEVKGKGYMAGKCETCGKIGHAKETCWYGVGRGNGGLRGNGNGNGNGNRGGNGYGNRNQGGNGGNGNRGNFGNQAGSGNRNKNNN